MKGLSRLLRREEVAFSVSLGFGRSYVVFILEFFVVLVRFSDLEFVYVSFFWVAVSV